MKRRLANSPICLASAQKGHTLEGNIVISVGLFGHSGDAEVWENMDEGTLTKTKVSIA